MSRTSWRLASPNLASQGWVSQDLASPSLATVRSLSLGFLMLLAVALPGGVLAHAYAPILLDVHEQADGVHFIWKESTEINGDPLATELKPRLEPGCHSANPIQTRMEGMARISQWQLDCGSEGLNGQTLVVDGLDLSGRVVMVRHQNRDRPPADHLLRGSNDRVEFSSGSGSGLSVPAYLVLGIEHILTGYDHLLFVACLMLLVGLRPKALLVTVTSFTVAHSLTLGAATFGMLQLPGAVVEALIAYSIVILAVDLAQKARGKWLGKHLEAPLGEISPPSVARYWPIAFVFGLIHGLGFSGVLTEIGLPQDSLIAALLMFNVGVELGQVLFILLVWLVLDRLNHWVLAGRTPLHERYLPAGYLIGATAAVWFWARLLSF